MTPTATPDAVAAVLDARAAAHPVAELDEAHWALIGLRRTLRELMAWDGIQGARGELLQAHAALCRADAHLLATRTPMVARFGEPAAVLTRRGR